MAKGDVNQDGLEDIYVGGAMGQAGALFVQQPGQKYIQSNNPAFAADRNSVDASVVFFDANADGYQDLYVASGGYHNFQAEDPALQDRLYLNDGQGNFTKSPDALPDMHVSKSCVAVHDINEDGHPDLFVGGRVIPGQYPQAPSSYILINDGTGQFSDQTQAVAPMLQNRGMVTDAAWHDLNQDGSV